MLTPEGQVKRDIKKVLDELGIYWHMPVPVGYGRPTLDFLCCFYGKFFAIEAKTEGGKVTPRQQETINEILKAGGLVLVVSPRFIEIHEPGGFVRVIYAENITYLKPLLLSFVGAP